MAFWGSPGAVLVWLKAPLLICHVPPWKDQAELGVLELNVSWNSTGELPPVMLIVPLAVPDRPCWSVAVTVTAYVPADAKVWLGLAPVAVPPSPKFQL